MQKAETWTTEIDFDMIATDKHLSLYDKELVGGQGCGPHLDKPSKPSSFLCQKKSGGLNKSNGERLDLKKGILWIESYNTQKGRFMEVVCGSIIILLGQQKQKMDITYIKLT